MKWLLILFTLVLAFGCGGKSDSTPTTQEEFIAYQQKFNDLALQYGRAADTSVIIAFGPTSGKAQCFDNYSPKRIYISSSFWYSNSTTILDREQLVFHELGLCALGRTLVEDCNVSIMCPYLIETERYQSNYNNYMNELFTN
jgi:hypothetical protein